MERHPVNNSSLDLHAVVVAAQQGEPRATGELIQWIYNELFAFCFYLAHDRTRAEDLCQETLIHAIEKLRGLKEPSKFKAWVFSIARNLFLDELKRFNNRAEALTTEHEDLAASSSSPDLNLAIRQALLLLSPEDRLILILVDLNSFSYQETAQIMKLTEEAVTSRLFRARKSFLNKF